jgi:hypothetical protein
MVVQKNRIKDKLENIDWAGLKNKVKLVEGIIEIIKALWSTKNISEERWNQLRDDLGLSDAVIPATDNIGEQVDTCYSAYIAFWDDSVNRYILNGNSCNKIVNDCGVVFALAAYSNRTFDSIKKLFDQKDEASETADADSHTKLSNDDIKAILNCAKDKSECLTDDTLRFKLCNQFTLNGENKNLEGDVDIMTYGADKLNEFDGTSNPLASTGGPARRRRRILTEEDPGYVQASTTGGVTLQNGLLDESNEFARIVSTFFALTIAFFAF